MEENRIAVHTVDQ